MDPSAESLASPGLNFLRILANSISIREDSSVLDLEFRRSEMKLLRPRACVDMIDCIVLMRCVLVSVERLAPLLYRLAMPMLMLLLCTMMRWILILNQ